MAILMRLIAALSLVLAFGAPLAAQPHPVTPDQNAPTQFDAQAPSRDQNLSERLDRSDGVIRPRNVDPEMHVPPPATADKMPVVPAPGSSGGDLTVKPK
ncbi:MAG: hypothetical protein JOZ94_04500 [Xanthobacteraceae bacterium]|nr:hypothetical protein [Xanthobacteraceae bacterium]MBV9627646.1 hypothetical protein [Xanthobacteraceae bacterium]